MNQHYNGKIIKGVGGFYYILVDEQKESVDSFPYHLTHRSDNGRIILEAKARGAFRHQKIKPVVGDRVQILLEGEGAVIDRIEERKNIFVRPPVANVDLALIVMAQSEPKPNLMLLDKLLIAAESHQTEPVIVLTKNDLIEAKEREKLVLIYQTAGYPVYLLWDNAADQFQVLRKKLTGKTAFLAGPSGVGKSTLANRLCQSAEMETGDLSRKLGRGKHTTRHVELLELDQDTYLLDTPGFSSFELEDDFFSENLGWYFREFPQGACRFHTCTHRHEPFCAVRQALEAGKISAVRYEHYCALYEKSLRSNKK